MNSSQMLYKISNLQHSIRMKEVEYARTVNAGDKHTIDLVNTDLALLKEDLTVTVKAFNSIPVHSFIGLKKFSTVSTAYDMNNI